MAGMSDTYTAVDLSRLPAPDVIEQISFEDVFAAMLADLRTRDPAFDALVESDPLYACLQVAAYRETLLRQDFNERLRGMMLAYASGSNLDHLGALMGVTRLQLDPGDPAQNIPATWESDTDFRHRIQLAPEGFSVAGPEGAYIYHALSADADVLDASAASAAPDDIKALVLSVLDAHAAAGALVAAMTAALDAAKWPGDVDVTILSRTGDGTAPLPLVEAVAAALASDNVRPMTDAVAVRSATIVPYSVVAQLYTFAGPDSSLIVAASIARLQAYVEESHRLGRDIPRSALLAALHSEGVQRVELLSPAADIAISRSEAAYCTAIDVTHGGLGE